MFFHQLCSFFYINDLAVNIKQINLRIKIDDKNTSILLYADDMASISDTEDNLQKLFRFKPDKSHI